MEYAIGSAVTRAILGSPTLTTICVQSTIQCIQTLAVTTQEIYGFISTIKETTCHVDIANLLVELDLEAEVLVLGKLLEEINIEKHHTQTLAISLKLLDQCLAEILKLLSEVNRKMDQNKKLWITFYGWRCQKFDGLGEKLRFHKINLDKRKFNLFEILKINSYLVPTNSIKSDNVVRRIVHECDDDTLNVSIVSVDQLKSNQSNGLTSYNIQKTYKK